MKTRKLISVLLIFSPFLLSLAPFPQQTIEVTVSSSADSGPGSFREALENAQPGTLIRFSPDVFPVDSPVRIDVLSPFQIPGTGLVTIDASSAGVILDGSDLQSGAGLTIESNGNIVLGLTIIDFPDAGIRIGNGAQENRIGGLGQGEANVLGGNWDGIQFDGETTSNNIVIGNKIGTDPSGMIAYGNRVDGIWIGDGAHDNFIQSNLISGNSNNAIVLENSDGNLIVGNVIGLDASGTTPLGNGSGIVINASATENTIGGLDEADRNVISGNSSFGISLAGVHVSENQVLGNYIGLTADGELPAGNLAIGVWLTGGAHHNQIGPGNIISHNGEIGILVDNGASVGNIITHNNLCANLGPAIALNMGGNLGLASPQLSYDSARTLRGNAGPDQIIEIFSEDEEGCISYLGETASNENGIFVFQNEAGAFQNRFFTATARDMDGNTSATAERYESSSARIGRDLPGVIGPAQISTEPAVIGTNVVLATLAVVYFGFTTVTFNNVLKRNSAEISRFLSQLVPGRVKSRFKPNKIAIQTSGNLDWRFFRAWFLIVLVNAIIESFLDPYLDVLAPEHLKLVLTLFIAGIMVGGIEWLSDHVSHQRLVAKSYPSSEIQMAGLLIGLATVIFSRLMHFTPGYLYGFVGIVYLMPKITDRKKSGLRALIVQSSIFIGGLLLWGLSGLLPEPMLWLEPFLLTAFLISLQAVLFELLPLEIFDGSDIWKWRKPLWIGFFTLVFFSFFHIALNPSGSDVQALQQNSVKTLLIVMGAFGLLTLGAWLKFSRSGSRAND